MYNSLRRTSRYSTENLDEVFVGIAAPSRDHLNLGLGTDDVLHVNRPVSPVLLAALSRVGDVSISGLSDWGN